MDRVVLSGPIPPGRRQGSASKSVAYGRTGPTLICLMKYALFSLPIHAGCGKEARAFLEQLERERKSLYAASEQRLGITREL
jgi:hypothetical protein